MITSKDQKTADAFADSWNHLPEGSVYTKAQFEDWMRPLKQGDFRAKRVLELGCGNGSLLVHAFSWNPRELVGVDLGTSTLTAQKNLAHISSSGWRIERGDLTEYKEGGFDIVYCVGVLQHIKNPKYGFDAMLRNTKSGGTFHGWVYAREGNSLIVYFIDPIRKIASRLPWWFIKYFLATPLVIPFYIYSKILFALPRIVSFKRLPLYEYALWIAVRPFSFYRHVAFDQLVTPQTVYFPKSTIELWLGSSDEIVLESTYIIMRNGNSWKFGGKKK